MRILTLGRLPECEIGGLPLYTSGLAEALVELGQEVQVVHPGAPIPPHAHGFRTHAAGEVIWPLPGRLHNFTQAFAAARALKQCAADFSPDVIHVQYGGAMDLAVLPGLARLGPPVVVTAHCGRAWSHLGRAPRLAAHWLRHVSRLLVLTEDQRELFLGAGLPPELIRGVGTLVDQGFFDAPLPQRLPRPATRKALYLGRIAPEKGLETVLTALELLDPEERPQFTAVGPISEDYAARLELRIQDQSLQDCFQLHPPVTSVEERLCYLDQADFLLHPTLSDVKPLVVIEAMARELPVLASSLPGTVELLSGVGATFPPGDAAELARLLERISAEPEFLDARHGAAGRGVAEAYTPAAAAQSTLAHFEECLPAPAVSR